MKIEMSAKCSDMFHAYLVDDDDKTLGEYDGYVPKFFPGEHYGDYVQLHIDVDTGRILNWKKPSDKDLQIFKPITESVQNNLIESANRFLTEDK